MSTRRSLKYGTDEGSGQTVHLYEEAFDENHLFLETIGLAFEAASSIELSGQGPGRVVIKLPVELAKIVGLLAS